MLNGGGINPDGLSLDLQFAADKTLTARRGPTPVFTRGSTGTFVGSNGLIQTAAVNGPRFDHDPVTLACKGLLIEEGRTNYLIHSQDFQNWLASSNVVSRNKELTIADPSGGFTANRIVGNSVASVYRDPVNGVPVGNRSNSIYARAVTGGVNRIEIAGTGIFVRVNLETGSLISSSGVVAGSVVIQPIGSIGPDGYTWYRISAVPTSTTLASMYLSPNPTVFTGDRDLFLLWGAQLEVGSFPTSYIPTTTGSVVRSADVCSITTAGWSNAGNDTMVAEYFVRNFLSGSVVLEGGPLVSWMSVSFTGVNQQRNIYRHGGTSNRVDAVSGTDSVSLTSINKIALTSGEQIALNGSLSQTLFGDPPQSDISTILSIGRRSDFGGANYLNGHIAAIRYFRKRLPDAKLQSLTAP